MLFGRQPARSLHFLGMVAYLAFLAIHLLMVVVHGFARELTKMTLGSGHEGDAWLGFAIGLAIIAVVVAIHVAATLALAACPRLVHRVLSAIVDPPRHVLLHHLTPVTNYPASKISPYFRVNGYPPTEEYPHARDDDYIRLQARRLRRLAAGGLGADREALEPLARRPPAMRASRTDHDAPLHPGLDRHRPLGGRPRSRTSSTDAGLAPEARLPGLPLLPEARDERSATTTKSSTWRPRGSRRRSWPTR